ncbi:MAG TPA: hypothetical protein VLA12_14965 [Planctomycetaceae bacterium]|nr:hypothetical protein [Planctomycetaceae bacterium]
MLTRPYHGTDPSLLRISTKGMRNRKTPNQTTESSAKRHAVHHARRWGRITPQYDPNDRPGVIRG